MCALWWGTLTKEDEESSSEGQAINTFTVRILCSLGELVKQETEYKASLQRACIFYAAKMMRKIKQRTAIWDQLGSRDQTWVHFAKALKVAID